MQDDCPYLLIEGETNMKFAKLLRFGGVTAAAGILLAQLAVLPAQALTYETIKDITDCNYYVTYDEGLVVPREGVEFSVSEIGVPASEPATEIWVNMTLDNTAGLPTMPAFGYYAPGYGDYDWFSGGVWMQEPLAQTTVVFEVDPDYPLPETFQIQVWGEEGETLDSITVNGIGIMTGGGGNIGVMTRKGDVNGDKTVNVADVVALVNYLVRGGELAQPANGDLDRNNVLNAADLTLLKRGILDGSLVTSADTGETAMEFVSNIKMGWNLGNTLDATISGAYTNAYNAEKAWGCPNTTKEMIDLVKESGFNAVRVPVSWGQKTSGAPDYIIAEDWLNRVQEIVDYVIDNDMYCILNIHHDNDKIDNGAYFYPDEEHLDSSLAFVSAIWTQVADRFEGYNNHLIFETLNEPRLIGTPLEWTGGDSASRAIVNQLHAKALEAIRATGGNNEKRFVMMPGYAGSPDTAVINDLELPDDDHLIVDIHGYAPYNFALNMTGTDQWSPNETYEIEQNFMNVKSKFLDNNIPVIVGEFGAMNKSNESVRAECVKYYLETANKYNIPCFWWDNNYFADSRNGGGESFGLINRNTLTVEYPEIMAAMVEATKNRGN